MRASSLAAMMFLVTLALLASGCVSHHYGWSYHPLYNPDSNLFEPHKGAVEFIASTNMPDSDKAMYRRGFIMIGYSNMFSPQAHFVAEKGARDWAGKVGAAAVVYANQGEHYITTYWARPKTFIMGALVEPLPEAAKQALESDEGVMIAQVVEGSPADKAGLLPGDLLLFMNKERIRDPATFEKLLNQHAGEKVGLVVWPFSGSGIIPIEVSLNSRPE